MIPHLDDATLSSLGIITIGARFNIRAAARTFEYEEQEQEEQRQEGQMQEGQVQEGQVQEGQVKQEQEQEQEQEEHEQEPEETEANPDVTFVEVISRQNKVRHYFLAGFFKF